VAVAVNQDKGPMFSLMERVALVEQALQAEKLGQPLPEVLGFDQLSVNFARTHRANAIVRGLRAVSAL
jgi:pantetheine-phosphate adenylyltransferase